MHHEVKLCQQFFKDKKAGLRSWELRSLRERNFRVGDTVTFVEVITDNMLGDFMPLNPEYGDRYGPCEITYIFPVDRVLLSPEASGWVIFTHSPPEDAAVKTKAMLMLEDKLLEVCENLNQLLNKCVTFDKRTET